MGLSARRIHLCLILHRGRSFDAVNYNRRLFEESLTDGKISPTMQFLPTNDRQLVRGRG